MSNSYNALKGEYTSLLSKCKITKHVEAIAAARKLIKNKDQYLDVERDTGVPACVLMAINMRESDGSMNTYLGNGDSLLRPTKDVPRGRGPFITNGHGDWAKGAKDALRYDHLDLVKSTLEGWSWPKTLYECELWNGFGYRNHGVHSPYVWAGTNIQQPGRYAGDGNWAPHEWDTQLGTVAVMLALIEIDGSLAFATALPASDLPPHTIPLLVPDDHGGTHHDTVWLQESLNHLGYLVGKVDGSFGRKTKAAVREYQAAHPPLVTDGLPGEKTFASIEESLQKTP